MRGLLPTNIIFPLWMPDVSVLVAYNVLLLFVLALMTMTQQ